MTEQVEFFAFNSLREKTENPLEVIRPKDAVLLLYINTSLETSIVLEY